MWKSLSWLSAAVVLTLVAGSPGARANPIPRSSPSQVSPRARPCRPPKHHKVLVDTRDLVMWHVEHFSGEFDQESEDTVFACVPPRGRTHIIGRAGTSGGSSGSIVNFKSAGSFVAVYESGGNSVGFTEELTVHDVRDGRSTPIVHFSGYNFSSNPAPASLEAFGSPAGFGIDEFAVDARGDVAWVGSAAPTPGHVGVQVLYVEDANGIHRVAATTTLKLVGFRRGQVQWTESARA